MKSICKNCELEFEYSPSNASGVYCTNKCQGEFQTKQRFTLNKKWKHTMGIFLKKTRGDKCELCGISDYNGKPLIKHVDHINGNRTDNRLENLQILCPNCHSQTETFAWKNVSTEGKEKQKQSGVETQKKKSLNLSV
jgi:5-methylcytosine-specific restriction endonuclease McrA